MNHSERGVHGRRGVNLSLLARADRLRVFSLRELWVRPGRTAALVTVMAIATTFLVAMIGISGSVTGTVRQVAEAVAGDADLEISGITNSGFDQDLHKTIAAVPGVRVAAPLVRTQANTSVGKVMVVGADLSGYKLESPLMTAAQGQLSALIGTPGGVLVGPAVARDPGSKIQLGDRTVTVAGVLNGKAATRVNQGYFVLAPLAVAQQVSGQGERLDSVLVALEPGADLESIRADLTTAVAGRAVVGDSLQRAAQHGPGIQILQYLTLMSAAVAFVVAAFLIYTVMAISISQRRPTLSVLRAVGGQPESLIVDLLGESAALGLLGGAVGSAVGVGIGRVAVSSVPTAFVQSTNLRLEYALPWYAVPLAVAVSIAMTVAAAAVAAVQIYRVSPLEALVPAEVAQSGGHPRWLRSVAFAVCIGLLGAVAGIHISESSLPFLSALTIVLFFAAGVTLCAALQPQLVAVTAALCRTWGGSGRLAAAAVERSSIRVWATLMTVVIAVGMAVTITGANRDTVTAATKALSSYADTTLFISTNPPDELPVGAALPQDLAAQVEQLPGVVRVVQVQIAFASLDGTKIALNGVSEGSSNPIYRAIGSDAVRSDLLAGRGVVLSKSLGKSLGVGAGDTVNLQTPHGVRAVRVLDLVAHLSPVNDIVGMSLEQLHTLFELPGATLLEIYAHPGTDVDTLRRSVRELKPPGTYDFTGPEEMELGVESTLRQITAVANAMWIIVVLIAALALLNTLTMSVLQRRREHGVLRAIGATPYQIVRMIVIETVSIGVVGGLVGLLLGLAGQYLYDLASPSILNFSVAYRPDIDSLVFAVVAAILCVVGCISPAIRAGNVNILQAINTD
ncbi:FtsX-like permease family protein [Nocardia sp. Marseille-Q1738]